MFVGLALAAVVGLALLHPTPHPGASTPSWTTPGNAEQDAGVGDLRPVAVSTKRRPGRSSRAPGRGEIASAARALVYVTGEVARPGLYPIGAQARVADALAVAGGPRPDADLVAVNLAAHLADGDEVVVPAKGEATPRSARRRRAASYGDAVRSDERAARRDSHPRSKRHKRSRPNAARASDDGVPPTGQVDVNTADAAMLATVPGIGAGLAERIVAFRAANGPFATVEELLDVSGITDRRLEAMLPYVVAR